MEETRVKRKSKDANRAKSCNGGSSKGSLDIKDKPRFKKRLSNQVPSMFPEAHDDRLSNPTSKK